MKRLSIKVNALLNTIRKTCNILLPLLIYPYISRVLGPKNYGKFSFSNSIINYFVLASMLGIESYAIREGSRIRDNKEKLNCFISEIFSINIILAMICLIILGGTIVYIPKLNNYKDLLCILSFIIPSTVLGRDYINVIFEDYLYITIRYIVIQVLGIIAIYTLVRSKDDYVIYTIIYTCTVCSGYILNLIYTRKYGKLRVTSRINLKKHIMPILILFCGQLAVNIYVQSDITMLGILRSDYEVGIYTLTSRIYLLTKGMINAISMVIIPRISYYLGKKDNENYLKFSNKLFDYLILMVIPLTVGLLVFSDSALHIVGGKDYLSGKTTLEVLSIALSIAVFSGFYCNAIMVPNRKENHFLLVTSLSAMINIVSNLILIPLFGMLGAAVTTLLSETLVLFLSMKLTRTYLKININRRNIISITAGGMVILLVSVICKLLISNYIISVVVAILLSGVLYYITLLYLENSIIKNMHRYLVDKLFFRRR